MAKAKSKKAKGNGGKPVGRRMVFGGPTPKASIMKGMQKYGM